nr:hypothetical protein [Clostridium estertheticum]
MVLGYVFSWSDFLGYAIGILVGVILEVLWSAIQKHKEMKI